MEAEVNDPDLPSIVRAEDVSGSDFVRVHDHAPREVLWSERFGM